jgi:putative dimethyl sulfoxide reductase chaperone
MDTGDFVSRDAFKMEAYKLLADCYYLPDPEVPAVLDRLLHFLSVACPRAAAYIAHMIDEMEHGEGLERLQIEYARLFVGPYGPSAPPYGSVYLENEDSVMGASTMRAREMYVDSGLDLSETFKQPPDHVAAELEFVHFLLFKTLEAEMTSDAESAGLYRNRRRTFLQDHLGAWVSEFALKVEKSTEMGFYRDLTSATRTLVEEDLNDIVAPTFMGSSLAPRR